MRKREKVKKRKSEKEKKSKRDKVKKRQSQKEKKSKRERKKNSQRHDPFRSDSCIFYFYPMVVEILPCII